MIHVNALLSVMFNVTFTRKLSLDKDCCQAAFLIGMVGIDFSNNETSELRAGDEHFQACHRLLKREASIDLRHISDGEIHKVDHIHVEMDHKPLRTPF